VADGEPTVIDKETGQEVTGQEAEQEIKIRSAIPSAGPAHPGFWSTVAVIELTDIAFAIDSILAAIALVGSAPAGHVGPHPKLWVVVTGGMLGVILMRFAAVLFIKLLERFPRFEVTAYLLVLVIGGKLLADWAFNSAEHPHVVDFHNPAGAAFWIFWCLMAACVAIGFLPHKQARRSA
jgi:predicted tellurium resistance membrane protein TerC